jgi:hypothetical protein
VQGSDEEIVPAILAALENDLASVGGVAWRMHPAQGRAGSLELA